MSEPKVRPPIRSGFCNQSSPAKMHGYCRKDNCPCPCGHPHWAPAPLPDLSPERAVELLEEHRVNPKPAYVPVDQRAPRITEQVTRERWYSRCRKCGEPIRGEQTVWMMLEAFYCTERCAARDVPK